jgi:spore coat protein A
VQFRVLERAQYATSGYDPPSGTTKGGPIAFVSLGTVDPNEQGFKDTIRVNPGEAVSIAARFDGFTGRFMYHCHILEHEDMDMMRPFIVVPQTVLDLMGGDMGGMSTTSGLLRD